MTEPELRKGWLHWCNTTIDTDESAPSPRPRVVLECPDDAAPAHVARSLAAAGLDVIVCNGPHNGTRCDLSHSRQCPLVDQADVVVNLLDSTTEGVEVRALVTSRYPQVPIVSPVTVKGDGDPTTRSPIPMAELIDAIKAALG